MTKKTNLDQLKSDIRIMGAYLPNALAIEHLAQTQGIFLDEYLRATDIWRAFGAIQRAVAAGGRVLSSTTTTSAALLARMGALVAHDGTDPRIFTEAARFDALARHMLGLETMRPRFRVGDKIFDAKASKFFTVTKVEQTGDIGLYPGIARKPIFRTTFIHGLALSEEANEPTPGFEMIYRD